MQFLNYRVSHYLDDSNGCGFGIFQNNLLSGFKYWKTDYEESNYGVDNYDVNLIYEIK